MTWLAKSSMREIERDRSIQHGNGYLAEGMISTCGTNTQQAHHTCVLSIQAIIHVRYNKLNNYDVKDIHCTAPSKMKLIYV